LTQNALNQEEIEANLSMLKQNYVPVTTLPEKLKPDATTVLASSEPSIKNQK
jgi:hypothetical protein